MRKEYEKPEVEIIEYEPKEDLANIPDVGGDAESIIW